MTGGAVPRVVPSPNARDPKTESLQIPFLTPPEAFVTDAKTYINRSPSPVAPRISNAGHEESPGPAITPRLTPSQQLRRDSFTNPFTTSPADVGQTHSTDYPSLGCDSSNYCWFALWNNRIRSPSSAENRAIPVGSRSLALNKR